MTASNHAHDSLRGRALRSSPLGSAGRDLTIHVDAEPAERVIDLGDGIDMLLPFLMELVDEIGELLDG